MPLFLAIFVACTCLQQSRAHCRELARLDQSWESCAQLGVPVPKCVGVESGCEPQQVSTACEQHLHSLLYIPCCLFQSISRCRLHHDGTSTTSSFTVQIRMRLIPHQTPSPSAARLLALYPAAWRTYQSIPCHRRIVSEGRQTMCSHFAVILNTSGSFLYWPATTASCGSSVAGGG